MSFDQITFFRNMLDITNDSITRCRLTYAARRMHNSVQVKVWSTGSEHYRYFNLLRTHGGMISAGSYMCARGTKRLMPDFYKFLLAHVGHIVWLRLTRL